MTSEDLAQIAEIVGVTIEPIRIDLSALKHDVSNIKSEQQKMQSKITGMDRKLTRAVKDISYIVKTFDDDIAKTRKHVEHIEDHLERMPINGVQYESMRTYET